MSTIMNTTYKIAIGADHAGVDLKETVVELLKAWGHEVTDMGTMTKNSCDYSDYANEVASSIADGTNDRGILICRSGIGMSIAANRWVGVRAALCRTPSPNKGRGGERACPPPRPFPASTTIPTCCA